MWAILYLAEVGKCRLISLGVTPWKVGKGTRWLESQVDEKVLAMALRQVGQLDATVNSPASVPI